MVIFREERVRNKLERISSFPPCSEPVYMTELKYCVFIALFCFLSLCVSLTISSWETSLNMTPLWTLTDSSTMTHTKGECNRYLLVAGLHLCMVIKLAFFFFCIQGVCWLHKHYYPQFIFRMLRLKVTKWIVLFFRWFWMHYWLGAELTSTNVSWRFSSSLFPCVVLAGEVKDNFQASLRGAQ